MSATVLMVLIKLMMLIKVMMLTTSSATLQELCEHHGKDIWSCLVKCSSGKCTYPVPKELQELKKDCELPWYDKNWNVLAYTDQIKPNTSALEATPEHLLTLAFVEGLCLGIQCNGEKPQCKVNYTELTSRAFSGQNTTRLPLIINGLPLDAQAVLIPVAVLLLWLFQYLWVS